MEIVGLKNFVQDDVNKLIAKFVGMPVHPVAVMVKPLFGKYFISLTSSTVFCSSLFLYCRKRCYRCCAPLEGNEMTETHFNLCSFCLEDGSNWESEEESEEEENEEYINYLSVELVEQRMRLRRVGEALI